jgi:hypothetical protein
VRFGLEVNTPIAPVNDSKSITRDPQFRDRLPLRPYREAGTDLMPSPIKLLGESLPVTRAAPRSRVRHRVGPARRARLRRRAHRRAARRQSAGLIAMAATDADLARLRLALRVFGVVFVVGLWPLTVLWPAGWAWHAGDPSQSHYLQMIVGIYATLGVFLYRAARDPLAHLSLIWFTVWSSIVHGAIMAAQAVMHAGNLGHLLGDVPALFAVAGVLGWLTLRAAK